MRTALADESPYMESLKIWANFCYLNNAPFVIVVYPLYINGIEGQFLVPLLTLLDDLTRTLL